MIRRSHPRRLTRFASQALDLFPCRRDPCQVDSVYVAPVRCGSLHSIAPLKIAPNVYSMPDDRPDEKTRFSANLFGLGNFTPRVSALPSAIPGPLVLVRPGFALTWKFPQSPFNF